jgi:hypothetical protein
VRGRKSGIALALLFVAAQSPAAASFHFMQVEKVMGGVCGDTSQQAIQLRMRSSNQNLVSQGRILVRDAAGANPITLIDFGSNVTNHGAGVRVLSQSAAFEAAQDPTTDFTLTSVIPASYLPAGSLTFESDEPGPITYWRLSWGGAGYTGSTTQSATNGATNTAPVFPTPLPWWNDRAIVFPGAAGATSTNNAADYIVSVATADFTNNGGTTNAVVSNSCVFGDRFETAGTHAWTVGP